MQLQRRPPSIGRAAPYAVRFAVCILFSFSPPRHAFSLLSFAWCRFPITGDSASNRFTCAGDAYIRTCRNVLKRIRFSCKSKSFFLMICPLRQNCSSRLRIQSQTKKHAAAGGMFCREKSAFCASRASCTSIFWRRFSSNRVAGETWSRVSCGGTFLGNKISMGSRETKYLRSSLGRNSSVAITAGAAQDSASTSSSPSVL